MKVVTPADRLIVAADFDPEDPDGRTWAAEEVLKLAAELRGTGVTIKVNSVLRANGYDLMSRIREFGLRVFADLKLFDIPATLATDGTFLKQAMPEILTVACAAGPSALKAIKDRLPDTEVLGITVLTSLTEEDSWSMYGVGIEEAAANFAKIAKEAGLDGLIASPAEATMLRARFGDSLTINTPAIRPLWYARNQSDDQNMDRVMTPKKAIEAGATRIVVGRPILSAKDRLEAVMMTIDEINSAMG